MLDKQRAPDLQEAVKATPILDAHTHLVGGRLGARGLHDILLYHMVISDLYAAGCPSGARLTEYPAWPTDQEAHDRIREAVPYLKHIRNTSGFWGVRLILADLYGWTDPIPEDNWQRLDAMIRERADDPAWQRGIMQKAGIQRYVTEFVRRGTGQDDDILQYSLEWAFFTRCQWGEHDTALYELERCWVRTPDSPMAVSGGKRPRPDRTITSLAELS